MTARTSRAARSSNPHKVSAPLRPCRSGLGQSGLWVHLAGGPPLLPIPTPLLGLPLPTGADRPEGRCQASKASWLSQEPSLLVGPSEVPVATAQDRQRHRPDPSSHGIGCSFRVLRPVGIAAIGSANPFRRWPLPRPYGFPDPATAHLINKSARASLRVWPSSRVFLGRT